MKTIVSRFMNYESGVTAIEYGLIAALVAVGIIAALNALGASLTDTFTTVSGELDGATPSFSVRFARLFDPWQSRWRCDLLSKWPALVSSHHSPHRRRAHIPL